MQYRNEVKHLITATDRAVLSARLRTVMRLDPHAVERGCYTIRSLYFDNWADTALREKLDGVNERHKFRIRCYNGDASVIHLEKKVKRDSLGYKVSCPLTAEETRKIIAGEIDWMPNSGRALVVELYARMKGEGLKPRTLVEYERIPFVYGPGNVRVTMDYNIRTGLNGLDFLNPHCPLAPTGDDIILEVKWDDYLPSVIRRAIQLPGRRASAFSKYAACRRFG